MLSLIIRRHTHVQVERLRYRYNDANQRTRNTREDDSFWEFGYDALGQVTSGVKKDSTAAPLPGLAYGYTFDTIGNRTQTQTNGQTSAYNLEYNGLNQYDTRSNPSAIDVVGTANASASVTVNFQPTQRQGEAFWGQFAVNNTAGPIWQDMSIVAALPATDAVVKQTGLHYVPPSVETYTHDLDGNLTADGRWTYSWDAENRLVMMESTVAAVTAGVPKQKLEFAYDAAGRRIQKKVSNWSGSAYVLASDSRFLYDGWNLVAEFNMVGTTFNVARTYIWGTDLSGSSQGAGGVGGLLSINSGGVTYFPTYDGNGNITGLVNAADGALAAEFEYDPFGNVIKSLGAAANAQPFGFSTKYQDAESGLLYYGLRYYNPSTGRWINRDPIEEQGGVNIYGFVGNDPINDFDLWGLWSPKGVFKFLCQTEEGRMTLKGIIDRMSKGWSIKTFDEMETQEIYDDRSRGNKVLIPGVMGYTDKVAKIIYIKDDSRGDDEAAKGIYHELRHSFYPVNTNKAKAQAEEIQVYEATEFYAPAVGFARD